MYQYLLFDLDGTLTDPGLGIVKGLEYALKHWNIEVSDRDALYRFIGPPLMDTFMSGYGFSEAEAVKAVSVYREYYSDIGLFENVVYPGVPELLKQLKAAGKTIVTATSKPEAFAVKILKHFGLDGYFDFIGGATFDSSRSKKGDVIAYVLRQCGVSDLSQAVMIGDRKHDIIGAKENGLDSIGVLYGYGNLEEMKEAGATHIAPKPEDILRIV